MSRNNGRFLSWCALVARLMVGLALIAAVFPACSTDKKTREGGLVIVVDSDLAMPKDIDSIRVDVTLSGTSLLHEVHDVGPGGLAMPAEFHVASTGDATPARIRGVAYKDGVARIQRDAVTPIPSDHVGRLVLPLDYLCDGTAAADGSSTCPDGQTCKNGACGTSTVRPGDVPVYTPSSVGRDGGSPDGGTASGCFDVQACFAGSTILNVDPSTCRAPIPADARSGRVNVALELDAGGTGICDDSGACWVVLDAGDEGWQSTGTSIALPPSVCSPRPDGTTPRIAVSLACATKTLDTPACGPWSPRTPVETPPPPPPVHPGPVRPCDEPLKQDCGQCGKQTRTCDNGVYSSWSDCGGEGACAPADEAACSTVGASKTCGDDCTWGDCVCPKGTEECGGTCVANDDVAHCGSCDNDCTVLAHVKGSPSCKTGKCVFEAADCEAGYADCNGKPADGCETDLSHVTDCGACGKKCDSGDVCSLVAGARTCASTCPTDKPDVCSGSCTDLSSDAANCKTCANGCPSPAHASPVCTGGACSFTCDQGYKQCGGACVNVDADPAHCKSCDVSCSGGKTCQANGCACPSGQHDCGGVCVSNASTATCGSSCSACTAPSGGTATCDGTKCGGSCGSLTKCGSSCVDTTEDNANCGGCGNPCASPKTCQSSQCLCPPNGVHDCNGACVSNTSTSSCGTTSCSPCPAPANGTSTCDGTKCGMSCGSLKLCGTTCVDTTKDNANCGGCGNPCTSPKTCQSGQCQCPANTEHDCGGTCVSNTSTATCGTSCSACPVPTNGTATCDGSTCGASCNANYAACGTTCNSTAAVACGHCGTQTGSCTNGTWSTGSCVSKPTPPGGPPGGYDFDDGTTQGFVLLDARSSTNGSTLLSLGGAASPWNDFNNYPNTAGNSQGDGLGSATVLATPSLVISSPTSNDSWFIDLVSPDLSDNSPFQTSTSFSFGVLQVATFGDFSIVNTQLLLEVEKCDGSTSYFADYENGAFVFCPAADHAWKLCTFHVTVSNQVNRIKKVHVRVIGHANTAIEGSIYVDSVHAL